MATRGRKPKPTALKILEGNPGKRPLNAFEPVVFESLFQSITILDNAVQSFILNCIVGITANEERCNELLNASVGIVTALCPYIGYAQAATLAKEALAKRIPIRTLLMEKNILTAEEAARVLDVYSMTQPGVAGK